MSTAPNEHTTLHGSIVDTSNVQTKGLDVDKLRRLVLARLRGYPPYDEAMTLRHFCRHECQPPVDPSNISRFLNKRPYRVGFASETVLRLARGLGIPVTELYTDDVA